MSKATSLLGLSLLSHSAAAWHARFVVVSPVSLPGGGLGCALLVYAYESDDTKEVSYTTKTDILHRDGCPAIDTPFCERWGCPMTFDWAENGPYVVTVEHDNPDGSIHVTASRDGSNYEGDCALNISQIGEGSGVDVEIVWSCSFE